MRLRPARRRRHSQRSGRMAWTVRKEHSSSLRYAALLALDLLFLFLSPLSKEAPSAEQAGSNLWRIMRVRGHPHIRLLAFWVC